MKSSDLEAEMFAAGARFKQAHFNRLAAFGVTSAMLAQLNLIGLPCVGVVDAVPEIGGTFQPGGCAPHLVQPIIDNGVLVDLVAWRSARPDQWRCRTGAGWALSPDDLSNGIGWGAGPPLLHATPLDWLVAGGVGSVILDWAAPDVARLRHLSKIECAADEIGQHLRACLMASVGFPEIQIMEVRHAA